MSTQPTSVLTFNDLILEVARKIGVASYGAAGTSVAAIPTDAHDLAECKRHVNNAIRMFVADAPKTGWRWTRPTASIDCWASVGIVAGVTITAGAYDSANDETPITANTSAFYESMEEKTIVATVGGSIVVKRYVSATQVMVYGNHATIAASTYTITADGNYTLPRTFAGAYTGGITFASATNRAVQVNWSNETVIRQMRENVTVDTGIPRYAAVSTFPAQVGRRRWQLMLYPTPYQLFTLQFPFDLHFDSLVSATDNPPSPIAHDEAIRAACLAVVERDVDDTNGPAMAYYAKCLEQSRLIDDRSGPRKLGYFGNDAAVVTPRNFREFMKRPNVTYNTP